MFCLGDGFIYFWYIFFDLLLREIVWLFKLCDFSLVIMIIYLKWFFFYFEVKIVNEEMIFLYYLGLMCS